MPDPATPQTPEALSPEVLQKSLAEIAQKSAKVVNEFARHQPQAEMVRNLEELGITKAFTELSNKILSNPMKLAEAQLRMWEDYAKLWNSAYSRFLGSSAQPVKEPARNDSRFKNEVWQSNFLFDYIKQSYLIAAEHIQQTVSGTQGLSLEDARKVKFFTRQYLNAVAPTNFVFTNPEVLKTTIESGGKNLLEGLKHLLGDLERGHGKLQISMTDPKAFKMGVNVAATPGKVVYQNDLMQLLQFDPTTKDVQRTPLIIVPPWINKYYILDLREKNSFIKWATDQGHTVFVISWVNPDGRHAQKTFADYLIEGPVAAMDAVEKATGETSVNMIGYCLGGTLTASLLAWLEAKDQSKRVKSMTFFTTMIDFSEPGELGVFVDENVVKNLEKRMATRGYLEGQEMAGTFNMLRDNDLIWSFVVNNYLMGKDPFPFDLLYWNSDATRMPAKMHTFYLRNMYIRNALREPGGVELAGEKLDLSKVKTPIYFISTMEDHIAPWKSTYAGAQVFKSDVRFVLGGSGHIAGIVNPPVAQKYCYWTNPSLKSKPDEWLASAQRTEGSWWGDWEQWIAKFGGGKVKARQPGDGKLKVIEPAPGAYAKFRLDVQTDEPASARSSSIPAKLAGKDNTKVEVAAAPSDKGAKITASTKKVAAPKKESHADLARPRKTMLKKVKKALSEKPVADAQVSKEKKLTVKRVEGAPAKTPKQQSAAAAISALFKSQKPAAQAEAPATKLRKKKS